MKFTITRSASHVQYSRRLFPSILGLWQEFNQVFTCMGMHVRSRYSCSKSDSPGVIAVRRMLTSTPGHLLRRILIGKCTLGYVVFSIHLQHSLQRKEKVRKLSFPHNITWMKQTHCCHSRRVNQARAFHVLNKLPVQQVSSAPSTQVAKHFGNQGESCSIPLHLCVHLITMP